MEYKTYCISTKCKNKDNRDKNYYTLLNKGVIFQWAIRLTTNNCEV